MDDQDQAGTETSDAASPWSFSRDIAPEPAVAPPAPPASPAPPAAPPFPARPFGAAPPPPVAPPPAPPAPVPAPPGVAAATLPPPPPAPPVRDWNRPPAAPLSYDPAAYLQPHETIVKAWYKRPAVWLLGLLVVAALLLVVGYLGLRSPERIDAQPAAPTPVGFQVVTAPEYQFAAPQAWTTKVLDDAAKDALARQLGSVSPEAGDKFEAAQNGGNLQGTQTVAIDTATGDNVNVIPYKALRGNPGDPDELAEIKAGFSSEHTGLNTVAIDARPADVHGFPAATVAVTASLNGREATLISTVIQTGDRVYQLTVTSTSAERAKALSAQILPTFAPH